MSQSTSRSGRPDARSALDHLEKALSILDAIDAPGNIGAHVDLAICELCEFLEVTRKSSPD